MDHEPIFLQLNDMLDDKKLKEDLIDLWTNQTLEMKFESTAFEE